MKNFQGSKFLSFVSILYFLSFLSLQSCQKQSGAIDNQYDISINEARNWYEIHFSGGNEQEGVVQSNAQVSSNSQEGGNKTKKLGSFIEWNGFQTFRFQKHSILIVDVTDKGIQFKKENSSSRFLLFYRSSDNQFKMSIVEVLEQNKTTIEKRREAAFHTFMFLNHDVKLSGQQDFTAIIYNDLYHYFQSVTYQNKNWSKSFNYIWPNKQTGGLDAGNLSASTSENCVQWGVFLVTKDEHGNVVSEELLYTYYRGNCGGGVTEEEVAPDYGGDVPIYENHAKMCGSYIWSTIGSAWYTSFSNITFMLHNKNYGLISIQYQNLCISLSKNNVYTKAQADDAWNNAWNNAIDNVLKYLDNGGAPGDYEVTKKLTESIILYLKENYPGASFSRTGCNTSGIPVSKPGFCEIRGM